MANRITATEAARSFSRLLSRARYAGESFVVVRNGEPMCRIEPPDGSTNATVGDLLELLERADPDSEFARDLEQAQKRQPRLPRSPWGS